MKLLNGKVRKASVLLFVMMSLVFLSSVLLVIMKYSVREMQLRAFVVKENSIRQDAYNVLNCALAELAEYTSVDSGLFDKRQGWGTLLADGRAKLPQGLQASVEVFDESGKLPLRILLQNREHLTSLLYEIGFSESDCSRIAQLLIDWTDSDSERLLEGAEKNDYEYSAAVPPNRFILSFDELLYVKEFDAYFLDEDGNPNEAFKQLVSSVSLYNDVASVNVNSASDLVLRAMYRIDKVDLLQSDIDAIRGKSGGVRDGVYWLTSLEDFSARSVNPPSQYVGFTSDYLRLEVRVKRGVSQYRITAIYKGSSLVKLIEGGGI